MPLQTVRLDLRDDDASAQAARSFVRTFATPWASEGAIDDAALLTSELVTNALRYGRPPMGLEVQRRHMTLHVGVDDAGSGRPAVSEQAVDAEGGRGLRLVEALSGSWGVDRGDAGKTVWFELMCGGTGSQLRPDDAVHVWNRFLGRWVSGFEVRAVVARPDLVEYQLRRRSDGAVLPVLFPTAMLRRAGNDA